MKKIYITAGLLILGTTATAQVLTNGQTSADLFNTNYFLDGSSFKNKLDPSVGKVLGFPQTDLTKFTFNLDVVENDIVTSGFDGVVVYNTATGKTLADASKGGKQVDVTPGFYYFSNPNGATNQTVSEGKWVRLGSGNETNQPWVYNAEGNAVLNYPLSKINAEFSKDQFILKNVNDDAYQYYSASIDGGRTKVSNSLFENSAFSQLFKVSKLTINNPLKPSNGLNSVFVLDKDAAQTSEVNGNIMNTFTDAENTQNYNNLRGLTALSSHNGTGSVSQLIGSLGMSVTFPFSTTTNQYGMFGQASNYSDNPMTNLTGVRAYASHRGNGTLTTLRGLESVVNAITAATGDITDAIGVSSNVLFNNDQYTGNITTIKGLNITQSITPTIATKVTNNYGLFIGDVTAGTRPYSIYTGAGAVRFGDLKGTGNRVVLADAEGKLTTGSVSSGDLGLWTNDTANSAIKIKNLSDGINERLEGNNIFINDKGYVGVGTKSPERKLHLVGNDNALGEILLQSASNTILSPGVLSRKLRGTIENPEAVMENDHLITLGGGAYDGGKYNYNRGVIFVNASENWTDVAHGTNITFLTTLNGSDTRSEAMRIENNGNVGIGTITPTEKLEVAGKVKATSFIGTNGASIFPDYVFQKYYTGTSSLKADYSFKTLSQVENFVKTNGHLPGYQSAEAIKKQGYIDLMATQLTNVEKIEELYLHSIEQDKALKAKDARIESLENKNKELETRLQKLESLLVK
ncbi:hypothetical protein [Riemerella anatipestifer]|uniref:hypothetical protein n=1 Tax=Riemerella anatipestifer TaxID=34085 RepID=UPI001374EA85|nr:hypothetical protein [Riemerella anatipestifer]